MEHQDVKGAGMVMARCDLIAAERRRQVVGGGFTPEHDAQHSRGELLAAAASYLDDAYEYINPEYDHSPSTGPRPPAWPWGSSDFKRGTSLIGQLVKVGALVVAEIDRLIANGEHVCSDAEDCCEESRGWKAQRDAAEAREG